MWYNPHGHSAVFRDAFRKISVNFSPDLPAGRQVAAAAPDARGTIAESRTGCDLCTKTCCSKKKRTLLRSVFDLVFDDFFGDLYAFSSSL